MDKISEIFVMLMIKWNNRSSQPFYAGLKGINLIQLRFMMLGRRRREESDDSNDDNKRPRITNGDISESELENNDNRGDNLSFRDERDLDSVLSSRTERINRPDYNNNNNNFLNEEVRRDERYIEDYYNSNINNIGQDNDTELAEFDNEFVNRLIETGNRDIVERITGIDPSLFESGSEDAYEGESEDDRSDDDNNASDNSSNSSGGENLPLNGNSSGIENSRENLSENPNSNANYSASDFFSFIVFQFLNTFSFILDIITQIYFS